MCMKCEACGRHIHKDTTDNEAYDYYGVCYGCLVGVDNN